MVIHLPGELQDSERLTPKEIVRELDKYLRQLQAFLIVANADRAYLLSGTGDLIQPDDGILAIGSGGPYALAAARALMKHTDMTAPQIAEEALRIAASICIYTNDQITVESL